MPTWSDWKTRELVSNLRLLPSRSSRSTQPRPMVWELDFRLADRLSSAIVDEYGQNRMTVLERVFHLPFQAEPKVLGSLPNSGHARPPA